MINTGGELSKHKKYSVDHTKQDRQRTLILGTFASENVLAKRVKKVRGNDAVLLVLAVKNETSYKAHLGRTNKAFPRSALLTPSWLPENRVKVKGPSSQIRRKKGQEGRRVGGST